MQIKVTSFGWMGFVLMHRAALGCVTCDSATACQVRHGIFGGHFVHTLLLTAAPFPVFAAAIALVYLRFPIPAAEQV